MGKLKSDKINESTLERVNEIVTKWIDKNVHKGQSSRKMSPDTFIFLDITNYVDDNMSELELKLQTHKLIQDCAEFHNNVT